jgi:hypothetical protein
MILNLTSETGTFVSLLPIGDSRTVLYFTLVLSILIDPDRQRFGNTQFLDQNHGNH